MEGDLGKSVADLGVKIDQTSKELKEIFIEKFSQLRELLQDGAPQNAVNEGFMRYERTEVELGVGTYGTVCEVRDRISGKLYAMKEIELIDCAIEPRIARELAFMFDIKHENIVSLEHVFTTGTSVCLVMERIEWNLREYLVCNPAKIDECCMQVWLKQLLSATAYLHKRNIIHRDMKPENILVDVVDKETIIKLADFGSARSLFEGVSLTPQVPTLHYRAPEVLLGSQDYTEAIDMWSIGCIFWEMANSNNFHSTETLFSNDCSVDDMIEVIIEKLGTLDTPKILESTPGLNAFGNDLLRQFMCVNPRERITAEDALKHPYFY